MAGLGTIFYFAIALFSVIILWLIGLLIGNILSKKKKIWSFYFFIILGIIVMISIIIYLVVGITG
jgi:hypothetical protein